MSKFCGACGAPLVEGAGFCGSCGASTQQAANPSTQSGFQPISQPQTPVAVPQAEYQPVAQSIPVASAVPTAQAAPAAKSSSPWVKVAIVAVVIIFVGGAIAIAGVIYVAHKVSQKAHEYTREVLGETAPATPSATSDRSPRSTSPAEAESAKSGVASGYTGDACKLLSKEDVSRTIGVVVVATQSTDGGCSYLAKGTSVDMTSKHAAAMMGAKGADKKTQGMFEQFAGVVGNSMPKKEASDNDRTDGNTVVLGFGIDTNDAEEQMKLNAKVLGIGGMGSIDAIDGIGDEAFSKADSMMFVREGDKLIRIMYMSCPCSTDAIKPLAKEIVANL